MKTPNFPEGKPSARKQAHSSSFDEIFPLPKTKARPAVTSTEFTGTENPRYRRAIDALMTRPMTREELDRCVGCSNGPDLVSALRDLGLEIPCQKVRSIDRDGLSVFSGVYSFTAADRRKINRWRLVRQRAFATTDFLLFISVSLGALSFGASMTVAGLP